MNKFDYIKQYYAVPAEIGRLVKVNGRAGIIVKDCGHHLGVNFDEDNVRRYSSLPPDLGS